MILTTLVMLSLAVAQDPLPTPPAKKPPPPMPVIDKAAVVKLVDELGKRAIEKEGVPALTIAVAKDGEMIAAKGFGALGDEHTPVTAETAWPIGSLTRQFTAVAVLQLIDAQKLALEDELGKLWPDAPARIRPITVQQLLSNTAGIPTAMTVILYGPSKFLAGLADEQELFDALATNGLVHPPGEGFTLDNAGYALLALIVQKISGQSFTEYVQKHVIEAVGLPHTQFCIPQKIAESGRNPHTGKYDNAGRHEIVVGELELPSKQPHERLTQCLCATAADLVKWQSALYDRSVFSERASRLLMTPTKLPDGNSTNYGYAIRMTKLGEYKNYAHIGVGGGVHSRLAYYSLPHVTIVVIGTAALEDVEQIERSLARLVLNLPTPVVKDVALPKADVVRCSGKYSIGALRAEVREFDGKLVLTLPGEMTVMLMHQGGLVFVPENDDDARIAFALKDDKVESFTLVRGGFTTTAKRVP